MQKQKSHANIVSIGKLKPSKNTGYVIQNDLLGALTKLTHSNLSSGVDDLFDNVDDVLFDMAEKAETNALQSRYFDGMREIRKNRSMVESSFEEGVTRNFHEFRNNELRSREQSPGDDDAPEELSLIGDDELEITLAVSNMVVKIDSHVRGPIYEFNERLAALTGLQSLESDCNPASAYHLCHTFKDSFENLDLEIDVKLIVFKLFDRYVLSKMGILYDQLNKRLIDAGILPELGRQRAKSPTPHRRAASQPEYPQEFDLDQVEGLLPEDSVGGGDPGGHYSTEMDLVGSIQSLLRERRHGVGPTPRAGVYSSPVATGNQRQIAKAEIIAALSQLQDNLYQSNTTGTAIEPNLIGADAIKSDIQQRFQPPGASGIEDPLGLGGANEDTIDLVGMLFEFIIEDKNLPDAIQALLSRLQIPYLKAAILDRQLFSMKQHPARILLNELANAGIGWSPEGSANEKLYLKMRKIVDTLISEFTDDIDLFSRLNEDFRSFLFRNDRRSQLLERRSADSTHGKEKLECARQDSADIIHELTTRNDGESCPEIVSTLLKRPWANVLVLTHLRKGKDSKAWRQAVNVAKELSWVGLPKESVEDVERLVNNIPKLRNAIRIGLGLIAYHEKDVDKVLAALDNYCGQQIQSFAGFDSLPGACEEPVIFEDVQGEEETDEEKEQLENEALHSMSSDGDFIDDMVESRNTDNTVSAESLEGDSAACLQAINACQTGTWFEFQNDDDSSIRAKLSWISPISGKFLFVNSRGVKVADWSTYELAAKMAEGHCNIIDQLPLIDRAMGAIMDRLRKPESSQAN